MITDLEKRELNNAIRLCNEALNGGSGDPQAYFNRGIAHLRLYEWDKARSDLSDAQDKGLDVAAVFISEYKSAGTFEDAMGLELPDDIADILDPITPEEDAYLARATEEGLKTENVSWECLMKVLQGGNEA